MMITLYYYNIFLLYLVAQRMSMLDGNREELPPLPEYEKLSDFPFTDGKTFQKRSVSSPAPVTMLWPSGLIDRYRTRYVWPVSVATFCIVGYFHTMIWFSE